ncbi:MAG: protein CapI [Rhodospirillaceae bacterium]|nr:protein CapI [Rhodospirillaceae bacterium]
MTILITGVAGFIGNQVALKLLTRGENVIGIDNLNNYYDTKLKENRLNRLKGFDKFKFLKENIASKNLFSSLEKYSDINRIIHLAAQAGVRYSISNPHNYVESNLVGHLNILEYARSKKNLKNLVYASSSSVYGGNTKIPFSVKDNVDKPISLYAATKKSDELLSYSYSHLFGINQVGLRFFTVYGPWGRPDMALFLFTDSIMKGNPIKIFNYGNMSRDFTYIDDIVNGTVSAMDKCPAKNDKIPHRVYNLGNDKPEKLVKLIELIEYHTGKKAIRKLESMQLGDVQNTLADIEESKQDLDFYPKIKIEEGVPLFIDWYREYFKL